MKYYLAVDIGASSGRHLLGWLEDGVIHTKEVYRFLNGMAEHNDHLCWDTEKLFAEILNGMKRCKEQGIEPEFVGIDTWAVDFVLLDQNGTLLGDAVGYRDSRSENMDKLLTNYLSEEALYARTGIQKQIFNTIYQLLAVREQQPELLIEAESLLLIPDYLHYRLCGVKAAEYTNATTTQLVNLSSGEWDYELMEQLSIPKRLFAPIRQAGEILGPVTDKIAEKIGYCPKVVLPATHDTGSAVAAKPFSEREMLFLSSGTWSLMGMELSSPINSEESRACNFTNEGGYEKRFRYLKNIMGLWMIQSVKKELHDEYSFSELSALAKQAADTPHRVNVNSDAFLAPKSMIEAIQKECGKDLFLPELLAVIYQSLSDSYRETVEEIGRITGVSPKGICLFGGGCQDDYLNHLTAEKTGLTVSAGPVEATAIGNLLVQMIADGQFESLSEARNAVLNSFSIGVIKP